MAILEFRWHARAGQGAVTAAKALADAALLEGKHVQAFPDYGPERMGAPIKAYNRIATKPIRRHGLVENPQVVIVVDPTLVFSARVIDDVDDDVVFLINTTKSPADARQALGVEQPVFTVDATQIAQEEIGLRKPNTPMLGAAAKVSGVVQLEALLSATEKSFSEKFKRKVVDGNLEAIRRAYNEVRGEAALE